jgi:hypothetical protein
VQSAVGLTVAFWTSHDLDPEETAQLDEPIALISE